MRFRLRPGPAFDRLQSTYWFFPSVLTASAVALSLILTAVDRSNADAALWLGWAYGGGAEGARAMLSAVAGSMITVVSVTFSVLVVALTVSSQHFGPRLLRSFMRDRPAQLVLGMFTGTFAYCLMVLRTVQGDGGDRYGYFVPHLAVAGAVALALVAVGVLIYYVHHVAVSMQVSEITSRVTLELEQAIACLYPEPIGDGTDPPAPSPPHQPRDAVAVRAPASGYVQDLDSAALLAAAARHDTTIWLTARPGDFLIAGEPIAAMSPTPREPDGCAGAVARAFVVGTERTMHQDAAFGVQQLVEVALRALSPSTNEPFTAMTAIDRLAQALSGLAARRIPSTLRTDGDGRVRVVAAPRTFDSLVREAFEPIALYAGRNPAIAERLFERLAALARAAVRPEDRSAIAHVGDVVWTAARRDVDDEAQRTSLGRLHSRLRAQCGRRHTRVVHDRIEAS